jgi:hypothetical protein
MKLRLPCPTRDSQWRSTKNWVDEYRASRYKRDA